jgi:hypothetical protein
LGRLIDDGMITVIFRPQRTQSFRDHGPERAPDGSQPAHDAGGTVHRLN